MTKPGKCSLESFWHLLENVDQRVLILDYDGTLAPFQIERDKAFPYPGVREILEKIQSSGQTRLIIVSGRAVADLPPLLGLESLPEIWGSHGHERFLPDGTRKVQKIDADSRKKLASAFEWMKNNGYESDCEQKPSSVAFHWRGAEKDQRQGLEEKIRSNWSPLTKNGNLQIHQFDGGLELRYVHFDKGVAVKQILSEYDREVIIAYLGDDLTDEDAFQALKGKGLSVLVRKSLRKTMADCWLQPPEELLSFLHNWKRYSA